MREMLLSFKPEIFDLIRSGRKIYEYRYQFPNESIKAYMYVSKPVQQIVGYVILGKRIELKEWKTEYKDHPEVVKRIDEYLLRNNKYVMPILEFHMTKPISLTMLNDELKQFVIPQSYYYMDTFPDLKKYIESNAEQLQEEIKNSFVKEDFSNICVRTYD